jgi:NAD(P)-dependent dehydrogenase (short-subunit alcohol dehydrogenase family)
MEDLKGKVAFITGGASGIGLGIAKACAKHGMKVIIADSRQHALNEAMISFQETGEPVYPIKLDVTDREAYIRAADEAEAVFGKIHVLVNNAGVSYGQGPVENLTYEDWDYGMSVNVGGVINGIMTILPRILKHGEGGHIVSTSSPMGISAARGDIIYGTTKYAVAGLMECLASDLQDRNIGASVLIPGPTNTNLGQSSLENLPTHLRNEEQISPPESPAGDQREWPPPEMKEKFMDPVESGERVVRGIRRNDLFIHTHHEFRDGYIARHNAIIRAIPNEPRNEKRWEVVKKFGTILYNDIYDRQKEVGPPDW